MPDEASTGAVGELWLAVPKWRDNRIASEAVAGLRMIWLFAVVFLAAGGFVLSIVPGELEQGNHAALLALVFPLAGLGLTVSAVKKTLEWRRFGRLALVMDPFPGSLGGDMGGTLDLPLRFDDGLRFKATLACCRVYVKRDGDGAETREQVIWDQEGLARATPTLDGTRLAFRFTPPEDLPESEAKSDDYKRWTLHFNAAMPGADLDRVFVVPVFRTGGQEARQRLADSREEMLAAPPPVPPRGLLRLSEDPYGLTLTFPALRNLSASLAFGLFSAIFIGASVFLTYAIYWPGSAEDDWFWLLFEYIFALIPLVMAGVFWLVALGLTALTLYMLGNALEVRVTPEEVASRRRIFGIPLPPRRLAAGEIKALDTEVPMRSGPATKQTKYRDLVAKGPGRQKVVLADGIRDPVLLDHLRRAIVRAGRLKLPG
jgi:hypothetical protein